MIAAAAAAEIEAFKAALLKAEVKDIEHGCQLIILPNGADGKPISWPRLASNVLFVRPEFKLMYEDKLGAFSLTVPLRRRNTLLRGVPGIGKSSFGMCVFAEALFAGTQHDRAILHNHACIVTAAPRAVSPRRVSLLLPVAFIPCMQLRALAAGDCRAQCAVRVPEGPPDGRRHVHRRGQARG